ncbi:MAG: hypothetical protein K1X92_14605 [Bacteroidia bacterium]|nr:hypothetical protein [Bacteroidia bacterium]
MKSLKISMGFILVLLVSACNPFEDFEKVKEPKFTPGVAFPLVNSSFTVKDILNHFDTGGYIDSVDDGIVSVVYRGHIFTAKGEEVYDFPVINNIPVPPVSAGIPYPSIQGEKITEVIFKAGSIVLNIQNKPNMFNQTVNVTVFLTDFKTGNQSITAQMTVPQNTTSSTQTISQQIDLTGKRLDLADNNITLYYNATNTSGQTVTFPNNELTMSLSGLKYSYLEGQLPNYAFTGIPKDTVSLDIFTYNIGGTVSFKDPRINLIVGNSFGVGVTATTDNMYAIDPYGFGQDITSVYNNTYPFPYPSINEVGQTAIDTFKFRGSNSNISSIIQMRPRQVVYEVSAELNPNNEPLGFVTDSSQFNVWVDVALPMWGKTQGLTFERDFEADFQPFDIVDRASFKLITENGFPVDLETQLYFMNGNIILDSLMTGDKMILKSGTVDGSGRVIQDEIATTESAFTAARFSNIKNTNKLRLKAKMLTYKNGTEDVKFYTDYGLTVKLGMIVGVDPFK